MKQYYKQALEIIESIKKSGQKQTMLLHSCCGPCSTACIEFLKDYFDITVLFYNPSIAPEEEYVHRANEQERYINDFLTGVKLIKCDFNPEEFYPFVNGYENCEEGGERCSICFDIRLTYTAKIAKQMNFDWFCTTLTVSPHKNAVLINEIGTKKEQEYGVRFFPSDFKKQNGFLNSIKLSEKAGLYRQDYCGCTFSKRK